MSYIFEALQRAEAERAGAAAPVRAESVAELLQEIEPLQQEMERKAEGEESVPPLSAVLPLEPQETAAEIFTASKVLTPAPTVDSRMVCMTDQGSLAAEQFRVLGLKLRHLKERRKLQRIVVTGSAPQEGKTLVALNLALNQARSKVLKTLLLDGDLRRPMLAERFGFDRFLPGLSECLKDEEEPGNCIYKIAGSGLWFMPAGHPPDNPLELMQAGRLPALLDLAGKFFDWIIVDSPPVTPLADTAFWMKQADGVLIVIREGVSERKIIEKTMNSLGGFPLLGVVVNSCKSSEWKDYYSHYGYARVQSDQTLPQHPEVNDKQAE